MGEGRGPFASFGDWLKECRIAAKLQSQPQAELKARHLGLAVVTQGKLSYIERGWNENPEPELLVALARLYNRSFEEILGRWIQARYDRTPEEVATAHAKWATRAVEVPVRAPAGLRPGAEVTVSFSAVPLLAHPIAAGAPLAIEQDEVSGYKAFDDRILKGLEPLCLRVGPREESMLPTIQPRDLLLIDRTPSRLAQPQDGRVYALNLPDSDDEAGPWGGTVKRLWRKGDHLVAVPDNIAKEPRVLHMQQSIATYVVGEVVWVGRELAARKGRP